MLYIFSGLPGTGKTQLARFLSEYISGSYLRIDSIEQSMKNAGISSIYDHGYKVACAVAEDNLTLGLDVVADSTNPVSQSRALWHQVAANCHCQYVDIEVICSDALEHRRRVESRTSSIAELKLPDWASVVNREFHPWQSDRLVIDTAGKSPAQSKKELASLLYLDDGKG